MAQLQLLGSAAGLLQAADGLLYPACVTSGPANVSQEIK
jgi:hypothetical protein